MYDRTKDVYLEQLITKRVDLMGVLIRLGIAVAVVAVSSLFLLNRILFNFFPVVAVGAVWGGFYLWKLQSIEFEYIITNGELDVDKIMGKRKRKRLLTVSIRDFEIFAPVKEEYRNELMSDTIKKRINAASIVSQRCYFAIFRGKDGSRTLLIIEPNEKILTAIKQFVPRGVLKEQ